MVYRGTKPPLHLVIKLFLVIGLQSDHASPHSFAPGINFCLQCSYRHPIIIQSRSFLLDLSSYSLLFFLHPACCQNKTQTIPRGVTHPWNCSSLLFLPFFCCYLYFYYLLVPVSSFNTSLTDFCPHSCKWIAGVYAFTPVLMVVLYCLGEIRSECVLTVFLVYLHPY